MITLNSDFMNYSDNPVGMENINTEDIFHIDVNSRQIIIPDSWTAVGALQDHLAEKIWFAIDRFFDDRDFATATRFSINFLNAASDGYIHNSTEVYKWDEVNNTVITIDNTEDDDPMVYNKILFRWRISQNVTVKTGKVLFSVRIGKYETLNDSVEATPDQDETTWMWNTTIASLGVLESVAVEAGVDSEGNEWGVNDMARWFYALSNAQISLNQFVQTYSELEHVTAGPKGDCSWTVWYYDNGLQSTTVHGNEPPFVINNAIMTVNEDGYTRVSTATWEYDMWINTSTATYTTAVVPEINDASTSSLVDTWSVNRIHEEFNGYLSKENPVYEGKLSTDTSTASGLYSVALGEGNKAIGYNSFTFGNYTTANGAQSVTEGYLTFTTNTATNAHAEGNATTASGENSHAEGISTQALGEAAHTEGKTTTASGGYSHAEGYLTRALGESSHAEGDSTFATTTIAHAEGNNTTAAGVCSHAEGAASLASGTQAHAEGNATTAFGQSSHAEGIRSYAYGTDSHAEGNATTAAGLHSHTEGLQTYAIGFSGHAEGTNSIAEGASAHAEGNTTTALAANSHTEGNCTFTTNVAYNSHAEGNYTTAAAQNTHVSGNNTIANQDNQTVIGKYNTTADAAFIIGNGSTDATSNAFVVDWNGNTTAAGNITINYSGTAYSLSALLGALLNATPADSGKVLGIDSNGALTLMTVSGGGGNQSISTTNFTENVEVE